MGREEKMQSTKFVPAYACWLAYFCAIASVWLTFHYPIHAETLWNGLAAHIISTVCIFCFSFYYSNTSIYDPFWCYIPITLAIGWMSKPSQPSQRAYLAVVLLIVWCARYAIQFPWTGWLSGISHEDWRYVEIAKKTGSNTPLYWLASLISLHLTPTLLVFVAISPVERVFSRDAASSLPFNQMDLLGVVVCLAAILLQHFADTTLFQFRAKAYGSGKGLDYKSNNKKICQNGVWKYSRHPNYYGETLFWLGLAIIAYAGKTEVSVTNYDHVRDWIGAVIILGFFRVSAHLTDQRMLKNRGDKYQHVMDTVSPLIPFPTWLP